MKTYQKQKPFRSQRYTRWVQKLTCAVCGTDQAIHPHHLKGHGHGGSTKADDRLVMPLCYLHHAELHDHGYARFDNRYSTAHMAGQIYFIHKTLNRAAKFKALRSDLIDEALELIA